MAGQVATSSPESEQAAISAIMQQSSPVACYAGAELEARLGSGAGDSLETAGSQGDHPPRGKQLDPIHWNGSECTHWQADPRFHACTRQAVAGVGNCRSEAPTASVQPAFCDCDLPGVAFKLEGGPAVAISVPRHCAASCSADLLQLHTHSSSDAATLSLHCQAAMSQGCPMAYMREESRISI